MSRIRSWIVVLVSVCAALAAAGCGGTKPIPTKGIVTCDGKPLANATVMFLSQEPGGHAATGFTDANGGFELTTFKLKDGALPGSYKVTIQISESVEVPADAKGAGDVQQAMMKANASKKASVQLPESYTRVDQTLLQHRVPGDGDAKFELQSVPPQ